MLYHPQNRFAVPEETARVARRSFPKGNVYMTMRDELGPIYGDTKFAPLFSHRGQRGISPGNLAFVSVVQFAEGLSDQQAAEAVRARIDLKYALGESLSYAGFDPSVLSEFRARVMSGGLEGQLLDDMLVVFAERGWVKARGSQRTDSTIVLAAIREVNRLELVGETLRYALEALAVAAPGWLRAHVRCDWFDRYGSRFEQYRLPKEKAEQGALADTIGDDGYHLLTAVYSPTAPTWLREIEAVQILRQVWLQQYYVDEGVVKWRPAGNLPPAAIMIQSPYDIEARYSQKREETWTGYKVHLTETCEANQPNLITNVVTTPATTPDVNVTDQVHHSLIDKGLPPQAHLVDEGYTDAEHLVNAAAEGIELLGPVSHDTSWQARAQTGFTAADFHIDWDKQQVTCPGDKVSRVWSVGEDAFGNESIHVRFAKQDCACCDLRPACTTAKQGRGLRLRPQAQFLALQARRHYQQTPQFKARYNQRAGLEGTISQACRSFDLRRSRYIGLRKTHLQHILIAAAMNLTRVALWLMGKRKAKTRVSHFAALAFT